ncbi:hypothetical protein JH06_3138 [Blastocystis sp. subtype 4]|uniref:hypothetical protein n=1 Tax=Blastocystis sp. subtype 4 TaxID=944170 RepID=UPI0007114325|nr:hypothetical protein JH06_3138 [Blastocystis sp. subtype 4]KNB44862.1 hypothetical protein JH06_3138 [Blastocystis sp. subtype 4]|eukprot:XP_014528305.1 hypothetical protein JH06_3138 [Blastocystis sp. subtype 4]
MKLEHDQTFLLEWYGEYVTDQKNRRSTVPCLVLHYSPLVIHSSLYLPDVTVLSIESMGLSSLGLTAEDRRARQCANCNTSVCRRCEFTEYPTYLRFNISRTYFDEKTYELQKDCSFVSVNPSLTIGTVTTIHKSHL